MKKLCIVLACVLAISCGRDQTRLEGFALARAWVRDNKGVEPSRVTCSAYMPATSAYDVYCDVTIGTEVIPLTCRTIERLCLLRVR